MIHVKLFFVVGWTLLLAFAGSAKANVDNGFVSTDDIHINSSPLPIDTIFRLPSPLPSWPQGGNFATGVIDIGGLQLRQVSSFEKISSTNGGGPDNLGATFYRPTSIPKGFSMLGAYAQPNNQPLFGWVLVGKTDASDGSGPILKPPSDFTLLGNAGENIAYFWVPVCQYGYAPVGLVVTTSPDKPSLDIIRCVRSDFTYEPEINGWIWGGNGLNVNGLRPKIRGTKAQGLSVGSFTVQTNYQTTPIPISCLLNKKTNITSNPNPNLDQIKALFKSYSPYIYFHPDENYLPSSVNWFFANGALLYKQGDEANPVRIEPDGSNLPQGGSTDGAYWIDLPTDGQARGVVQGGDKQLTGPVYLHVKPVLGSTHTDIQIWIFYPFNGHGVLKLGPIKRIQLGRIGEHVGDWEHVTLRISNFDGALQRVYFAEHGGGAWVDAPSVEFRDGNKVVVYASLNGHASYSRAGLVLLGDKDGVGIRDDTAMGPMMDAGVNFEVVAAEGVRGPPWLGFAREWGPKIAYDIGDEVRRIEKVLFGPLRKKFRNFIGSLPPEFYGQEGPTGPKVKNNWDGDEV